MTKTAREDTMLAALALPNKLVQSYLNAFVQFHAAQWQMWVHMSAWALPGARSATTTEALTQDQQHDSTAVAEVTAAAHIDPLPEPASVERSAVETSPVELWAVDMSPVEPAPVEPQPVEPQPVESKVPPPAPIAEPSPARTPPRKRAAKAPSTGAAPAKAVRPRAAKAKAAQAGADPAPIRKRIRKDPGDLA